MEELRRTISFPEGFAIAVSMVVGSGLLGLPGTAIEKTDHVTALYAWLAVVCVVAPFIHIFSQLGSRFPDASGIVGFAAHGLGHWSQPGSTLVACGALAIGMPALFLVGGSFAAELFSLSPERFGVWFAVAIALATTLLNVSGIKNTAMVNGAVVGIIAVFTLGVVFLKMPSLRNESFQLMHDAVYQPPRIGGIALAATIIFWAFQGWENLSFGMGDFQNPSRTIPRVYWSSFGAVSVAYLMFAWVVSAVHYDGLQVKGLAGVSVLLGTGQIRILALIMLAMLLIANANSWVFGASRLFYSAAQSSLLPPFLAKLNDRKAPVRCLIASGVFYCGAIVFIELLHIKPGAAFVLTSAGFIALYAISVATYLASNRLTVSTLACALLATVGLLFLMQALKWYLLYPTLLFCIGTTTHALVRRRQHRRKKVPTEA